MNGYVLFSLLIFSSSSFIATQRAQTLCFINMEFNTGIRPGGMGLAYPVFEAEKRFLKHKVCLVYPLDVAVITFPHLGHFNHTTEKRQIPRSDTIRPFKGSYKERPEAVSYNNLFLSYCILTCLI